MSEQLILSKFGDICAVQTVIFENNKLINMKYDDYLHDIKIESDLQKDGNYISTIYNKKSCSNILSKDISFNISKFFNNELFPTIYNINNCENNKDTFSLNMRSGSTEISMIYDKSKTVTAYQKDSLYIVYNNKIVDSSFIEPDFDDISEIYKGTNIGLYCDNVSDKTCHMFLRNGIIDYNHFLKTNNRYVTLDKLPTLITYTHNDIEKKYHCKYDKGIMIYCTDGDNEMSISRSDRILYNDNEYVIKSVHPHFYDPFNFNYIDIPFKYWVEDCYEFENGIGIFTRNIYRVESDKLDSLLNNIKLVWNIFIPVIKTLQECL